MSVNHHLFTWSKQKNVNRKLITKAKGVYFWDSQDSKYLDFASQLVNVNLGHCHPKIIKRIISQVKKLDYIGPSFASIPKLELSRKLVELTGLSKAFFTTGGGEANENAFLIARQFSQKDYILSRNPSYHGATYSARTAGKDVNREIPKHHRPPCFDSFSTPICNQDNHHNCCQKSLNELKSLIKKHQNNIAAVILEPIPGAQGVFIPSDFYLKKLIDICRKSNIVVIFDEVMTGFGRTGKWFSYQHWGVKPDIVTLSKGINGGAAPLGAVIVSSKIAKYFDNIVLSAGLTNSGHPLSCACALEAINIYQKENLIENSQKMGQILELWLNRLLEKYSFIKDVRSLGLFACIELDEQKYQESLQRAKDIAQLAFKNGVYVYQRLNCLLIAPPLIISKYQLNKGLQIIEKVFCKNDFKKY